MKNKQQLFRIIKIVIVCYCLVGTAFYYLQEKLIFHPTALTTGSSYHFTQAFTEANIELDAQTHFNIVQFILPDSVTESQVLEALKSAGPSKHAESLPTATGKSSNSNVQ